MNREQYEIWFIDYFDGLLTESQVADLMVFLDENPDLKTEFEAYQVFSLKADPTTVLPNKLDLKHAEILPYKSVHSENYEAKTIDYLDGVSRKKGDLEHFYEVNPELTFDPTLYEKSTLRANPAISFPTKSSLKRRQKIRFIPTAFATAVAASIALFIWFTHFSSAERIENHQIAIQIESPSSLEYLPTSWSFTPQTGTLAEVSFMKKAVISENHTALASRTEEPAIELYNNIAFYKISTSNSMNNSQLLLYQESQLEKDLQLALQEKEKTSLSKFAMAFNTLFKGTNSSEETPSGIWKAVNWGIQRYNYTTGNEIGLARIEQSGSNHVTYAIAGENFAFQRNFKKKEY